MTVHSCVSVISNCCMVCGGLSLLLTRHPRWSHKFSMWDMSVDLLGPLHGVDVGLQILLANSCNVWSGTIMLKLSNSRMIYHEWTHMLIQNSISVHLWLLWTMTMSYVLLLSHPKVITEPPTLYIGHSCLRTHLPVSHFFSATHTFFIWAPGVETESHQRPPPIVIIVIHGVPTLIDFSDAHQSAQYLWRGVGFTAPQLEEAPYKSRRHPNVPPP